MAKRITRVLHLHSGNLWGGIETVLETLALANQSGDIGMETHVALCFEGQTQARLARAGAQIDLIGRARFRYPWTLARAANRLNRLMQAQRYDVFCVHGVWAMAAFSWVARANRLPVVFWAHDPAHRDFWLDRLAARFHPDAILVNSRHTLAGVPTLYPGVYSEVIYNPIRFVRLNDRATTRKEVREELGIPADTSIILQAGRFERWKGHLSHVRTLGAMQTKSNWISLFAGGVQRESELAYKAEIDREIQSLGLGGRVRFLGQRSDVARLLRAADVYFQPNEGAEPFGNIFVEAMFQGLPVVTSAIGGALEIVTDETGILIPLHQTASFAAALDRLLGEPATRARMGACGQSRAESLCNAEKQVAALARFFGRAAAGDLRPSSAPS